MDLCLKAASPDGLSREELESGMLSLLEKYPAKKVLIIPPDFSRYFSNAGFLTNFCYHYYCGKGAEADILPALGTHVPVTKEEFEKMFGDIPFEKCIVHNWRTDVEKLGEVPASYMEEISEGLWTESISAEINRRLLDPSYDLILSVGQVVPHEVIGMANHTKNLFVGVGGSDMINKSHMVGAVYGMERIMGKDHTPVRKIFDYAFNHYLKDRPILFLLTVTTAPENKIQTHGLFCGRERDALEAAIALAQEKNIDFVETGLKKCVVYLDPNEFKSTWLGNKAIYRTRMAMADDGDLIILAPGIERFGEDPQVDVLIRKYGYSGRKEVLRLFQKPENADLRQNMGAAAHLIHGSSDGRFRITYAVKNISREEISSVGYIAESYDRLSQIYDPQKLQYGYNTLENGEEIFYIPNPALGLWINREKFRD